MYKVTFAFINQPKILCCKKIEEGPLYFTTLMGIIRNPEINPNHNYGFKNNFLVTDSYDEFKDRKMIKVPINCILLIEEFDVQKLKNYKVIAEDDDNVLEMR